VAFDQQEDNISQINITPLVDVMLVLLVIFMVTAPILQQGVAVDLPQVSAGPVDAQDTSVVVNAQDTSVVVTVGKDGKLHLDNRAIKLTELSPALAEKMQKQPNQAVYLRADKSVPYGKVVEVMAVLRNVGVKKLGMMTAPTEE
jgi:biopolymer transport protein TolR